MSHTARIKGEPVEMFFYLYTERVGRFWKRQLARNTTMTNDYTALMQLLSYGRYRVEWRDARRWVVRVQTWIVDERGLRIVPPGHRRKRVCKVPRPIYVPPRPRVAMKPYAKR